MIQFMTTISFTEDRCPIPHVHAYLDGSMCCKSNLECDGVTTISLDSTCCFNNEFTYCPEGKCVDGGKKII